MSDTTKKRKKVCTHCGQKLWLRDFYRCKDGTIASWCKECTKANKREWYSKTHKVPDGIRLNPKTGMFIVHQGLAHSIYWNKQMLDNLKRFFPTTKNDDLVDILGVSKRTLIRKARELGIEKDPEWQHTNTMRALKIAQVLNWSRDYPNRPPKGYHFNPEGEFKKGHTQSKEIVEKRTESLRLYYKNNPFEAKKRGKKISETKKRK